MPNKLIPGVSDPQKSATLAQDLYAWLEVVLCDMQMSSGISQTHDMELFDDYRWAASAMEKVTTLAHNATRLDLSDMQELFKWALKWVDRENFQIMPIPAEVEGRKTILWNVRKKDKFPGNAELRALFASTKRILETLRLTHISYPAQESDGDEHGISDPPEAVVDGGNGAKPAVSGNPRISWNTPPKNWRDIKMRVQNGNTITVTIEKEKKAITPSDMNLADKRNGAATRTWDMLIAIIQKNGQHDSNKNNRVADTRAISRLRNALKTAFPSCEGDPIPSNAVLSKQAVTGWVASFTCETHKEYNM